jgi:hypothetical protein
VVSQDISYSIGHEASELQIEMFDTQGGTRQLTGLTLSYDQTVSYDFTVESNGYTAVEAGDWEIWSSTYSIHQFGSDPEVNNPFLTTGGAGAFQVTADLGASDGFNGTGADTYTGHVSEQRVQAFEYDRSTTSGQWFLDAFTGEGSLTSLFGGIIEAGGGWNVDPGWVVDPDNPPEGPFGPFEDPYYGFFLGFSNFNHSGILTVNYEYATVPAPSGMALVAGIGLLASRRRR